MLNIKRTLNTTHSKNGSGSCDQVTSVEGATSPAMRQRRKVRAQPQPVMLGWHIPVQGEG